jgi:hypothetical protein
VEPHGQRQIYFLPLKWTIIIQARHLPGDPLDFTDWLKSVLTSTVAASAFTWLFLQVFERALNRSVQRDLESHKSLLQLQSQSELDRHRSDLQLQSQTQLERHKSELMLQSQQQVELIKHELQKQMLRAQLSTTKTQEIYSKLIQQIRIAEGAVGHLWGLRSTPTYEGYSREDIEELLKELKTPGEEEREILKLLTSSREAAIEKLRQVGRRQELHHARGAVNEASNLLIREAIFVTKSVRDLARGICNNLYGALAAVETGESMRVMGPTGIDFHDKYSQKCAQAADGLEQLEDAMRTDLLPVIIQK